MREALMFALAAALLWPVTAAAQDEPFNYEVQELNAIEARANQVVDVINGTLAPEEVFTKGFQAAVSSAQIKALGASLTAQFGAAVEVALLAPRDGTRAALEIRFERGIAKGGIAIDESEELRISELVFTSVDSLVVADDTPEKITADLAALPGTVNAWFAPLDGSTPVISIGADTPLALGSTVKLYVLAALAEDVRARKRRWSDAVPLTEKSFPSGQLQNWPKGSPLTLHTLASLMISISDNTATDQLITILGKNRILKMMRDSGHSGPATNDPFLTTRELFMLKADDALIARWRSADPAAKFVIEAAIAVSDNPPLDAINAAFANGPKALDIEWFASPADLAKLFSEMRRTADPAAFEIMAINPSATPAIRANWDYIGYKGGSEPGVLNLTWLLRDAAGRDHVLTLGWNNPDSVLDEGKLEAIAQRILLLPH